jgi:HEAT repeat protein
MELAAENPRNFEKLKEMAERDRRNSEEFRTNAGPILEDLRKVGCYSNPPEAIILSPATSPVIVAVLIQHLDRPYIKTLKERIIRALNARPARGIASKPLVAEYHRLSEEQDPSLRWVIGDTLSDIADDSILEDIEVILRNPNNGKSREMFVLALARMKHPRSLTLLVEMLKDEQLAGHAIIALRKLKAAAARDKIMPFLSHPTPWIRKEAKKFLERY